MKHLVCWIDIMRISELEYQSILAKRGQPVPIPVVKELPPAAAALAKLKSNLSVNAGAKQVVAKGKGSRRGSNAKRSRTGLLYYAYRRIRPCTTKTASFTTRYRSSGILNYTRPMYMTRWLLCPTVVSGPGGRAGSSRHLGKKKATRT